MVGQHMEAVVLAGGLGLRLRSLLGNVPKALAPVAERPFLEYLILQLKKYEFTEIILCVGYKAEKIQEYFGKGDRLGVRIKYSCEWENLLGTGGALRLAQPLISGDVFLVLNGDSFFNINLKTLVAYHQEKKAIATMALAVVKDKKRFGTVDVNWKGEIVRFVEKGEAGASGLVNGGIYVFRREVLNLIPEGRQVSLEHEVFPNLIGKGFYGVPFRAFFVDIGVPEDYLRLQADPSLLLMAVGLKEKGG